MPKKSYSLTRTEIQELQNRKLRALVKRMYDNSPFYRRRLNDAKIKPDDIKEKADLRKIPFTTKTDLRDNYPLGMLSADSSTIVRMHASSGTTGNPTVVAYSAS
ncbi:MAG TPA: hypothetical protein P5290_05585, partial [Candidatus Methanomethylicus sp.]|nr:hypothetical protein [Candidatus Methanomethylicus sp.]